MSAGKSGSKAAGKGKEQKSTSGVHTQGYSSAALDGLTENNMIVNTHQANNSGGMQGVLVSMTPAAGGLGNPSMQTTMQEPIGMAVDGSGGAITSLVTIRPTTSSETAAN